MLDQVPVFTSEADYSLHTVNAPDKAARHKALIATLVQSENLVRQLIAQKRGQSDLFGENPNIQFN